MVAILIVSLSSGCFAAWRSHAARRAYNRRMFPSMQDRRPVHLLPFFLFTLLGVAVAGAIRFLNHP